MGRILSPATLMPEDFYLEEGRMVFTEQYHRRRGSCCESGCRHCPWDFTRTSRKVPKGVPATEASSLPKDR